MKNKETNIFALNNAAAGKVVSGDVCGQLLVKHGRGAEGRFRSGSRKAVFVSFERFSAVRFDTAENEPAKKLQK